MSAPTGRQGGLEVRLHIDRATVARLGVNMTEVDNTLYDAFGQRLVSTIYQDMNQYHVVMEVAPSFWQSPETLASIYVSTAGGALERHGVDRGRRRYLWRPPPVRSTATSAVQNYQANQLVNSSGNASTGAAVSTAQETMVPLSAFSYYGPGLTPLAVNHQGPFVATTFSFNLPPGEPLGTAVTAIHQHHGELHVPISIQGDVRRHRQGFPADSPRGAAARPGLASLPSTSCSASSTRVWSSRSPFSRRCPRAASARCSRCSSAVSRSRSSPSSR